MEDQATNVELSEKDADQLDCSGQMKGHWRMYDVDATTTPDKLVPIYNVWFETYEVESAEIGYVGPQSCVSQLANFLKTTTAKILDVGAGTGLVGEELKKLGYNDIDALDLCESMLIKAREKNMYEQYFVGAIGGSEVIQSVPANSYDATICVGVFTKGHVKANGFDDLLHLTKPGGLVCVAVREDVLNDPAYGLYQAKIDQLQSDGHIHVLYRDLVEYLMGLKSILFILEKIQ